MGLSTYSVHSRHELVDAVVALCAQAVDTHHATTLIAPDETWVSDLTIALRRVIPLGVKVQTFDQWVAGLWEVYGSGAEIVTPLQRQILLRPLVTAAKLTQAQPSAGLVKQLGTFASEALATGLEPNAPFTDAESTIMGTVIAYGRALEAQGLVEAVQAEERLLELDLAPEAIVCCDIDLDIPSRARFIQRVSEKLEVAVVERELSAEADLEEQETPGEHGHENGHEHHHHHEERPTELVELQHLLYTGHGGLASTGAVIPAEARGAHVEGELVVELVKRLEKEGFSTEQIVVVFSDPAASFPHVQDALAQAGIPFACTFSVPLARTGLGAAYVDFIQCAGTEGESLIPGRDRLDSDLLMEFVATPYAGLDAKTARAVQMYWRSLGGSRLDRCWTDIETGFTQGNVGSKTFRELLEPLRALRSADPAACARLMFENAKHARVPVDVLVDDKAAAETLLRYFETCLSLGTAPSLHDVAELPVSLSRAFGDPAHALSLGDSSAFGIGQVPCTILADLDASTYPMCIEANAFEGISRKLGIAVPDTTARKQRLMLLTCIEASSNRFCFYRATHDKSAKESCQSALWDELMAVYRSAVDEELPIQEVPEALRGQLVGLSEQEVFSRAQRAGGETARFSRGRFERAQSADEVVCDYRGRAYQFSPTALEDYYRCPYRWYVNRRVGVRGMDSSFDESAQGNLAHGALERFYLSLKEAGHDRVTPENLDAAIELMGRALDEQVMDELDKPGSGVFLRTSQDGHLVEELRGHLIELVERDATFLPGYTPTFFEMVVGKGADGLLDYGTVPVRGKVDRIDIDDAGHAVIIDYKMSKLGQGYGLKDEDELPLRIQTDIYARLVQRSFDMQELPYRVVGSVYRSYQGNMLRGVYSSDIDWGPDEAVREDLDALPNEHFPKGYEDYLGQVEEEVASCMARLATGDIAPDPRRGNSDICQFCNAASFCPKKVG